MKNLTGFKVRIRGGALVDIEDQYKAKNDYHKSSARRSFEEKIRELLSMQKIVNSVNKTKKLVKDCNI